MSTLLDDIITQTPVALQTDTLIRVRTTAEFLSVASISDAKPVKDNRDSDQERFCFGIFRDLFRQVKFLYEQYKSIDRSQLPVDEGAVTKRLNLVLESIRESFDIIKQYFWDIIENETGPDAEAAIFSLSCLATDRDDIRDTSLLVNYFEQGTPQRLNAFIRAFSYSTDKEMCQKLLHISNSTTRSEIKAACGEVIRFRKNL